MVRILGYSESVLPRLAKELPYQPSTSITNILIYHLVTPQQGVGK